MTVDKELFFIKFHESIERGIVRRYIAWSVTQGSKSAVPTELRKLAKLIESRPVEASKSEEAWEWERLGESE